MLKSNIFRVLKLTKQISEESISDADALNSLSELVNDYSDYQNNLDENIELRLYSSELNTLIKITNKAKEIDKDLESIKLDNIRMLNELYS